MRENRLSLFLNIHVLVLHKTVEGHTTYSREIYRKIYKTGRLVNLWILIA